MIIYTIGFTEKSAADFFGLLRAHPVQRVIDIRLKNNSQLAGFAKRDDLEFFLKELCEIDYLHMPELAPSEELFESFKKKKGDWDPFAKGFVDLMRQRKIAKVTERKLMDHACLLCSEHRPELCHRTLLAEHLKQEWGDVEIRHLF